MICCGEEMGALVPNTVEASAEKHLPVLSFDENKLTVKIGSAAHPMMKEHSIQWVYLQQENGGQRKCLNAGDVPEVTFNTEGSAPVIVYAYCNLHGLWATTV